METQKLNVLFIGAHPDDCEIKAGGTIRLYCELGHNVRIVSVTNGNAGHHEMNVILA
jgi:LmbE family N-acetylglucosaminyl deacetylase